MKILFVSLGCDKNLVDSEKMLGLFGSEGYTFTDDETKADIIIINTCCFINDAKEESIQTILEMAEYKDSGSCKVLIVTGCMAQRYREEILEEIPEVDEVLGTTAYENIAEAVRSALGGRREVDTEPLSYLPLPDGQRILTTGGHYAYLKIAEGCDKHCTYCIIPKLRGPYRSVPMETLVREAQQLADQGVKELILVAQETTLYGMDLYGCKSLHTLLKELCEIDGLRWIRILYCYPEEIYDELIETIKTEPKICHYLDIPVQHASDEVLRRMGRRTTRADLTSIIKKLRREIPDIVLRTTFITGFPQETQEQHEEAMDFIRETEFDRLGVFTYSQEEDTPAYSMPGQHDEETKSDWKRDLMELQQDIAFDHAQHMEGKVVEAMVEGELVDDEEEEDAYEEDNENRADPPDEWLHVYAARTYGDAPDVDGLLFIQTDDVLMSGDFVKVRITGADEYDLIGEIDDEYIE